MVYEDSSTGFGVLKSLQGHVVRTKEESNSMPKLTRFRVSMGCAAAVPRQIYETVQSNPQTGVDCGLGSRKFRA